LTEEAASVDERGGPGVRENRADPPGEDVDAGR
jgi:hypothetical protein